jgi:hypothetical protein
VGLAGRKAATQHNTNREKIADINPWPKLDRTHDPSVRAGEEISCLRPSRHSVHPNITHSLYINVKRIMFIKYLPYADVCSILGSVMRIIQLFVKLWNPESSISILIRLRAGRPGNLRSITAGADICLFTTPDRLWG